MINKGKDFTLHSIEINAIADPGSYVAFAAMPNDLYSKGMNDGLTENNVSFLQVCEQSIHYPSLFTVVIVHALC